MTYLEKRQAHQWTVRSKPTITDRFLLPMLELPYTDLIKLGFLYSFNGHIDRPDKIRKELVLVFDKRKFMKDSGSFNRINLLRQLQLHPYFSTETFTDDLLFLYYDIPLSLQRTVVSKFWNGLYSEISHTYINKYFTPFVKVEGETSVSLNHQILTKSPSRRVALELSLDCVISDEAELLSKPDKYQEIYGFPYEPTIDDIRISNLIEETKKFINERIDIF
jgi:hypothetical protein